MLGALTPSGISVLPLPLLSGMINTFICWPGSDYARWHLIDGLMHPTMVAQALSDAGQASWPVIN